MKHIVSTNVLQQVVDYLANRPYTEVAELILALQKDVQPLEENVESSEE
jgi:hypothetical protein